MKFTIFIDQDEPSFVQYLPDSDSFQINANSYRINIGRKELVDLYDRCADQVIAHEKRGNHDTR